MGAVCAPLNSPAFLILSHARLPQRIVHLQWTFRQAAFLGEFCWQVRWASPFACFAMQACFQERRAIPSRDLLSETEGETSTVGQMRAR